MHSIQNVAHSFNLTISYTHQVALNLRNTFPYSKHVLYILVAS